MPDDNLNFGLFYRITRMDSGQAINVKRDADPPVMTGGGSRWNVVDRPRRGSFTTYDGTDPYRMDLPILFDHWQEQDSVEDDIAILNQMRRPSADYSQPPIIHITGAVPVKSADWVIEGEIDWGDAIWHPGNYRLRQHAVVHLLQYVTTETLSIKPPATAHTYTIKKGDTLKSISQSQYGTTKYWTTLKSVNKIRDAKKLPKTLRIPVIVGK